MAANIGTAETPCAPPAISSYSVQAALSARSSAIRFSLDAALGGAAGQLSTQSQTIWTWTSAHESGSTVPAGWQCGTGGRQCRVEPLLTLGYSVSGMALDGSAPSGKQVLVLSVRHLPLATAISGESATVQVSFDGGVNWQSAQLTGGATLPPLRTPPFGWAPG
jgi:hypothetical protein